MFTAGQTALLAAGNPLLYTLYSYLIDGAVGQGRPERTIQESDLENEMREGLPDRVVTSCHGREWLGIIDTKTPAF